MKIIEATLFVLLLSHLMSSVSEQEDPGRHPVPTSSTLPFVTYAYTFDETTSQDVCPVLATSIDALIQPDIAMSHLGGQFFTSPDLDRALFRVLHIVGPCRRGEMVLSPSTNCDQLLIRTIRDIRDFGNFSFQYIPQGENRESRINVRYGPAGLTFIGDRRSNNLVSLDLDDVLRFELRVDDVDLFDLRVCESIGNSVFEPSVLLLGHVPRAADNCIQAFGSYSTPYLVDVSFNLTVDNPSVLTLRKIKIVLGNSCDATGVVSGIVNIQGASAVSSVASIIPTATSSIPEHSSTVIATTSSPTLSTVPKVPVAVIAGPVSAVGVVVFLIIVMVAVALRFYNKNSAGNGNDSSIELTGNISTVSMSQRGDNVEERAASAPVSSPTISPLSTDGEETDLSDERTIVISYARDSTWSSEFTEKLKPKYDASLKILDDEDEDSIKEVLRNHKITTLFVVTDEQKDMQLLRDLEYSPALPLTTIITGTEHIEQENFSIDVLQKRTAIETAEKVLSRTSADGGSARTEHLQNRNFNTSPREGKNKVKKSWPFRTSMPKLARIEKKQHSSLKNVGEQMILHDIRSQVFGIQKTLEHMQDQQDAAALDCS